MLKQKKYLYCIYGLQNSKMDSEIFVSRCSEQCQMADSLWGGLWQGYVGHDVYPYNITGWHMIAAKELYAPLR